MISERIHQNILTEAEIAERHKQLTSGQIEDDIALSRLDGYELADLVSLIRGKAREKNPDFDFDVEPLRNALAALENERVKRGGS